MAHEQSYDEVVVRRVLDRERADGAARALGRLLDDTDDAGTALRFLLDVLPLAVLRADAGGTITRARGSALDRLGDAGDRLAGSPPPVWGEGVHEHLDALRAREPRVVDIDGARAGEPFRYRVLAAPDGEGGSIAVLVDLTETLTLQRESASRQAFLDAAIEGSGAWLVVQDSRGRVLTASRTARDALGIEPGDQVELGRLPGLDPIHRDGRPFDPREFPSALAARLHTPQRGVLVGFDQGGERRWMSVTATPISLAGDDAVATTFADPDEVEPTVDLLRDSDERFRLLAEEAPVGIFIVGPAGELLYVNPAAEHLAGRAASELRELGWLPIIHPDDQPGLVERSSDLGEFEPVEYRVVQPDGELRWVRATGAAIRNRDGEVVGMVGTAADVTALREADDRLRASESRTRAILETAAEGIVSCDEVGRIIEFNAAAERIFGWDSDDVIGSRFIFELVSEQDRGDLRIAASEYLAGRRPSLFADGPAEVTGRRSDGTEVPVELAVTEIETESGHLFTALIRDLSQHKAYERELEHLATHDALTGLPNRALLTAQLDQTLQRADRLRRAVAVLFVEVDRVKNVTEALGHRAGDELIEQASVRIVRTLGSAATVGRFSNDQFVVLLEDLLDAGDAVGAAVQIIEAVAEPFIVAADEAFVHATVGIAFALEGLGDAETLISNAAVAMGRAKVSSATRYEVFDSEMRALVEAQRKTEIALRHGIDRDEFELHYQPVVALASGEVRGYEALVRWNHPTLGTLPPGEFMPLAEESGLIVPLGERILHDALGQVAAWRAGGVEQCEVAINLSARQLESPDFPATVRRALEASDADPADVVFEITETALLDDVDGVVATLQALKDLGVRLSLDDFGTGYSSLAYLCRLPIDVVKVDRSFVSQLGTGSPDASIVEMVVTLAGTLHLDVVAEGVETEEQARVLRDWGCGFAQGYLFARPRPVAELDLGRARPA